MFSLKFSSSEWSSGMVETSDDVDSEESEEESLIIGTDGFGNAIRGTVLDKVLGGTGGAFSSSSLSLLISKLFNSSKV